ncbi:hypothetical protein PPL_09682 [Heterostelium album PN500]|uniref:Uncharacterized protein n=1 Tax=Heterostelium pallidum (strain ATCC 26659 / Pp 5 / PN500) TaxID=670386 RepID=D3BNH9_HETP5|nr:hypothetical protein PPL_09682 [Heterostelium album PN500]EFA76930.1 hypothetical protein PPL_09682 [Heterostelium album PN500]|eukprot:XP_020429062.1 hypothetical protein PPL_09682 [Heterostelium album PN500]
MNNKKRNGFVSPAKSSTVTISSSTSSASSPSKVVVGSPKKSATSPKKSTSSSLLKKKQFNYDDVAVDSGSLTPSKSGFRTPIKMSLSEALASSPTKCIIPKDEIFSHCPTLSDKDEAGGDIDIQKQKEILSTIYSKNEPFSLKEIKIKSRDDPSLVKLVERRMIIEIKINNQTSLYSSIQWFKIASLLMNMHQQQVKEESTITTSTNTTTNPKKLQVATKQDTPIKVANHLGNLSSKRKSITTTTPLKLKSVCETSVNTNKKQKIGHGEIYPLESAVDEEVSKLEEERRRLLESIRIKKEQLASFTSKSKPSPIEESKKHAVGSNKDGNIDKLLLKWKDAAKIAVQKLQDSYLAALKKQEDGLTSLDPKIAAERRKQAALKLAGFRTAGNNNDSWDGDNGFNQSHQQTDEDQYDDNNTSLDQQDTILDDTDVTSKLYIMKLFSLDHNVMNYDKDSDSFK